MSRALDGVRVVEFAGLGPAPFACMLLADMGADVVTVQRPGTRLGDPSNIVGRGRSVVMLDLKAEADQAALHSLIDHADVLIEGFRPGVMERLGLGPDKLCLANPRLVYGRMTGWGQHGPLAQAAGHDLNYIALAGAAYAIGPEDAPVPPLNLVGDYAGGSLFLINGILAALLERERSGRGQVIDAAITDGTLSLMSTYLSFMLRGQQTEQRHSNMLDGGAPYYACYRTFDDQWLSIAAIEPAFFNLLCKSIGLAADLHDAQNDRARWPVLRHAFETIFAGATLADWCARLEGSDCCFAPVLPLSKAKQHPHNRSRQAFVMVDGVEHPAPAPRLSRTPSHISGAAPSEPVTVESVHRRWAGASHGPV